jgi:hypothetical protein
MGTVRTLAASSGGGVNLADAAATFLSAISVTNALLLSPHAATITGQVIDAEGGNRRFTP